MAAHEHHRHRSHCGFRPGHAHGVMSGAVVRPYDLIIGGVLMRGTYAAIATLLAADTPRGGTVVDIGTGPGRLPVLLAQRRPDLAILGVDPSADMLARARRRAEGIANVEFLEATAESVPRPDGSASAIVSTLSSHHWADLDAALREQSRLLAPGGALWLADLRSELAADLHARLARAGLSVRDDGTDRLPRGARRRLGLIQAVRAVGASTP